MKKCILYWCLLYDVPVSFMTRYPIQYEEGVDTGAYLGRKGWIQGHILREIKDFEFGTHGFLMNHVFLPTKQAETNIC